MNTEQQRLVFNLGAQQVCICVVQPLCQHTLCVLLPVASSMSFGSIHMGVTDSLVQYLYCTGVPGTILLRLNISGVLPVVYGTFEQ